MLQNKIVDSIIDLDVLSKCLSNDQDFMYELLNNYVKDLQQKLKQIEIFLMDNNLSSVLSIIHSLKGSTSCLNMHYIWQAIGLFENALKRKDFKMIDIYYEVLSKEHEQLVEYMVSKNIIV